MPESEVVYTVHKFVAENVDEISIDVGEKVVILEKDDGYNDGWFQGRNERGEIGLFPIVYTAKQLPPMINSSELGNKIDSLESTISKMKPTPIVTNFTEKLPATLSASPLPRNSQPNNPQTTEKTTSNSNSVEEWTSDQVATWLMSIGFDKELADNFKDQEISGDILLELTLDSLKELQITTFGKRFKVHNAINSLRQGNKKNYVNDTINQNQAESRYAPSMTEVPTSRDTFLPFYHNNNNNSNNKQIYPDDDLVSNYSAVIRNSQLRDSGKMNGSHSINAPSIHSVRSPMSPDNEVMALSSRMSNIAETRSISSERQQDLSRRPSYQQMSQPTSHQLLLQQQQQQLQHKLHMQQQQQQQQQQSLPAVRPTSQQLPITSLSPSTSSEWKRNTISNVKRQEPEGRTSTSNRYSFMKTSLSTGNKLHSILPNAVPNIRRSEDAYTNDGNSHPDMEGWLYKQGDKYKTWNKRWFVLKGSNLFYFKSPKVYAVRMKGIINLRGYRIEVDETIHPGYYCFLAHHDHERTFYFYTEHEKSMKDWLKALMKATIARDYSAPVMSSSTVPTISLEMARKLRPRPPSTIFESHKDESRPSSPIANHQELIQPFSLMSMDERSQPIIPYSQQHDFMTHGSQSKSPSLTRLQAHLQHAPSNAESKRHLFLHENLSEHSVDQRNRFKDSGFNSTHHSGGGLTRSVTQSSHGSSGQQSVSVASLNNRNYKTSSTVNQLESSTVFNPDEEDEDLIDPEHMSVIGSSRVAQNVSSFLPEDEEDIIDHQMMIPIRQDNYVNWINSHLSSSSIKALTDLSAGDVLVEFLESLSNKEISKPMTYPSQSPSAQRMDRVIAAFKFMTLEGIELNDVCSIRDVLNGNEIKIMRMLDTIENWFKSNSSNGKKMASGGTFGEDDQLRLQELQEVESSTVLPLSHDL
ncbi:hypothetical protein BD560DRAFT_346975 [Blakeslea trispora]|nr:hypothetical protein BD560DRAFT_346975 [Blakeslea trispora]